MSSIAETIYAVRHDHDQSLPAVYYVFDHTMFVECTGYAQLSHKVFQCRPMFAFSIFATEFLEVSSSTRRLNFQQVLIKILSSELNIFHFIASQHES